MKKLTILSVLFILIFGISLNAQNRIAVLPFTGGAGSDGDTIANLLSNELRRTGGFRIVPRTSAMNAIANEQKFQRTGLTDADTIAEMGRIANADYVAAGHIVTLGNQKLVVMSITEVETLHQTAGSYETYSDLSEIADKLQNVSKILINNTNKNAKSKAPTLAVLPFNITVTGQANTVNAEVLAQILACEIANSSKYAVVHRTSTIERIMAEQKIQRSGLTESDSIKKIGEAINAKYVLSGTVSKLGSRSLMYTQILDVQTGDLDAGESANYQNISGGTELMAELSYLMTGVKSANARPTIADIIAMCDKRAGQTV